MATYTYRLNMGGAEEQLIEGILFKKATNINYSSDQLDLNKWVPAKLDKWVDGVLHNSDNEVPYTETLQEKANIRDAIYAYDSNGNVVGLVNGENITPLLSANKYIKALLPLSQSGGASVLPIDYSLKNVSCTFGGGAVAPWANAGYFTSDAGTQSYLSIPNSAFNPNLFTDSFIIGFTLNKNTETGASTNTLLGNSDGSATSTGIFVLYGQTSNANANKLGVRIMGGSTSLGAGNTSLTAATYASSATLVDANDHRVVITWDAITKIVTLYVDGAALYTSSALAVTATDKMAGNFRFGQGLTGVSVLAKFAGIQLIDFPASGLPINIAELISYDNSHKRTGLADQHFFF